MKLTIISALLAALLLSWLAAQETLAAADAAMAGAKPDVFEIYEAATLAERE